MPPHGFGYPNSINTVYNTGAHGQTYNEIYANTGDDIDIDPNRRHMMGIITLRANSRHNLKHGDKLWFTVNGMSSRGPIVNIYQGVPGVRNFGPHRNLRRSNIRNIGYLNRNTYGAYNSTRANAWDAAAGPRVNQVWQNRCNMYFVGRCTDDREVVDTTHTSVNCWVIMDWT